MSSVSELFDSPCLRGIMRLFLEEIFAFLEEKGGLVTELNLCVASVAMARNLVAVQVDPSVASNPGDAMSMSAALTALCFDLPLNAGLGAG